VGEVELATAPLGLPMAELSFLLSTTGVASSVFEQAVASSSRQKVALRVSRCFILAKVTTKPRAD
jgi:hypothetical protein